MKGWVPQRGSGQRKLAKPLSIFGGLYIQSRYTHLGVQPLILGRGFDNLWSLRSAALAGTRLKGTTPSLLRLKQEGARRCARRPTGGRADDYSGIAPDYSGVV